VILMRRPIVDEDLQEMRRQLGGVFDAVPASWTRESVAPEAEWQPAVEMFENGQEVVVRATLPNIDPHQVDITITNETVTLKGSRNREEQKDCTYYLRELLYGRFLRTVPLPTEVKAAEATASYSDGVLEVRLPKSDRAKNTPVKVVVK
jgi:HSP20 family protein